jgi:DNA-binding LytR/AlgR family response regulator
MKVLIIEDEYIAARRLQDLLKEIDKEIEVLAVLDSVEIAVAYLKRVVPADLIFMDIELGDGQSFEILEQTSIDIPIIFITAYREHTLKAFKVNSVDYLLKPLNKNDLTTAILKFKKHHSNSYAASELAMLLKDIQGVSFRETKSRFLARSGTRLISTSTDQIAYFYTREKLQYIKTIKNEDLIIDKPLDEVEKEVDPKIFFRANRQFILNYNHIEKVNAWFSGKLKVQVQPPSYEDIIVSRLRAADFKKWLGE